MGGFRTGSVERPHKIAKNGEDSHLFVVGTQTAICLTIGWPRTSIHGVTALPEQNPGLTPRRLTNGNDSI